MRLVHLTDPHLTTPPPWQSLGGRSHFGKRFLGYASWARKRRFSLRRAWLDELTVEVAALNPDLLLLSGDLTQIGTAEELAEARHWLEALASIARIVLVPGNHDTYANESWSALTREWVDFLPATGQSGFPSVQRLDDIAVLGLSSAVPTRPLSACGLVGPAQLEKLKTALLTHQDAFKFLFLHHPPLPDMINFRKRLRDAPALAALLADQPVNVVLHGHRHRNQASVRQGMKIYCTAPASAAGASFRLFDVTRAGASWQVRTSLRQRSEHCGFETHEVDEWSVSVPG